MMKTSLLISMIDKMRYKNWGIQAKLVISFTTIFIVMLFIVIEIYYTNIVSDIKRETIEYSSLYIKQLNQNINKYIYEFERLTAMTFSDAKLQSILKSQDHELSDLQVISQNSYIENFLFNLYSFQPDINNIVLVSKNGKLYSEGVMRYCMKDVEVDKIWWYRETVKKKGRMVLFPDFIENDTMIYNYAHTEKIFTITRQIKEIERNNEIGVIRIDIPFEKIEKIVDAVSKNSPINIIVLDNQNNVIIDSNNILDKINKTERSKMVSALRDTHSNYYEYDTKYGKQMMVYNVSSYTGWNIIGFISQDELLEKSKESRYLSVVLVVIGATLIILLCLLISMAITKPIKVLQSSMQKVEKGNFDIGINVKSGDEIGYLGHSFNRMVNRIKDLIKREYELTIRKREAELKALTEEISPHFLYNTLESIRVKALMYNATEVSKMIEVLCKFLRLNIIKGNALSTIEEELEHVRAYIFIQNIRHANKFNYIIDVEDELFNAAIPKLSLQPLVENSILHGFKLQKGECVIIIHGRKQGRYAVLEIIDNGKGLENDELNHIQAYLRSGAEEKYMDNKNHMGLQNVNQRIKLHFGEQYGIKIESEAAKGVRIKIQIPYILADEGEMENDKSDSC